MRKSTNPRKILADNLTHLMEMEGLKQEHLAKRSGVAQTTISAILKQKSSATVDKAGALAGAFGLELWQLLMPDLPDELKKSEAIPRLYANYVRATEKGRRHIDMTAEREAEYSSTTQGE